MAKKYDADQFDHLLRTDFQSFVRKVFLTLNPGQTYYDGWHISAISYALMQMAKGQRKRQIITMPPRYLKSTIISIAYVAWLLGHNPTMRIIVASYSDELAKKFSRDTRRIMTSDWYKSLFPKTRLDKFSETELATTLGGFRLAVSVGGTFTGRGGDLVIIDDPINASDAMSESERRRVLNWFRQTVYTRLDDKKHSSILVVMQRVHENDLVGHLFETNPDWAVLKLAAIAPEDEKVLIGPGKYHRRKKGDLLHPAREGFAEIEEAKRNLGSAAFSAQYQQEPLPAQGNIISRSSIRRYDKVPPLDSFDLIYQSWDVALKCEIENDYSAGTVWGIYKGDYYILHVDRVRESLAELAQRVRRNAYFWQATTVLVEDVGPGWNLLQTLDKIGGLILIKFRPEGSKEARLAEASVLFEAGSVLLPKEALWLADYEQELLGFPSTKYDDQVDSTSQFLVWHSRHMKRRGPNINLYLSRYPERKLPGNYFERNGVRPPF